MSETLPPLIDTHAHLDSSQFRNDLAEVLARAEQQSITAMLTVGCDLASSRAGAALATAHDGVYASVGIHPHDAAQVNPGSLAELAEMARSNPKVVAIGETGLDFYRDRCPRPVQMEAFRAQIRLARQLRLPLIIHDRDAHQDILDVLREEGADQVGGVLHCFSGDLAMARECLELGFYLSFSGTLTYPRNDALREVAKAVPTERLLLETDCPYLAPQEHRGRRNEPALMRPTAEALAALKGLTLGDISRITLLNTFRLFGFGAPDMSTKIAYRIRDALYLNITNRCSNTCVFCAKFRDFAVKGHLLQLDREPSAAEIKRAVGERPDQYEEVVFCGYGESLLRLDTVKEVAAWLQTQGVKVRVNTDGLANLVYGRNILPELAGLVNAVSVSLNAPDAVLYQKLCQSRFGEAGYQAVKDFIREARQYIPSVTASVVAMPEVDIEACRRIAEEELGVRFRVRPYNEVG